MSVKVLLFAALRESAGMASLEVEADSVAELLDQLRERFGEPFATRLDVASVLVDGQVVHSGSAPLADGAEVALLPPFSGGAGAVSLPVAPAP